MYLEVVMFKRKKNSPLEKGLMINHDRLIVDKNSKPVPEPIWDMARLAGYFCVEVDLHEEKK